MYEKSWVVRNTLSLGIGKIESFFLMHTCSGQYLHLCSHIHTFKRYVVQRNWPERSHKKDAITHVFAEMQEVNSLWSSRAGLHPSSLHTKSQCVVAISLLPVSAILFLRFRVMDCPDHASHQQWLSVFLSLHEGNSLLPPRALNPKRFSRCLDSRKKENTIVFFPRSLQALAAELQDFESYLWL